MFLGDCFIDNYTKKKGINKFGGHMRYTVGLIFAVYNFITGRTTFVRSNDL